MGGNEANDLNCTGTKFIRQTVQIRGTVSDTNPNTGSIEVEVATNTGETRLSLNLPLSCNGTNTECEVTADFDTVNINTDSPHEVRLSGSDLASNEGIDTTVVTVDNTSPQIGGLGMDQSEYLVSEPITVTAWGVADNLPGNTFGSLCPLMSTCPPDSPVDPAPSGVKDVGAKVTTPAGTQPAAGTGNFPGSGGGYNALTQDSSDPSTFSAPPTFLANAAGDITAEGKANDKVGNLSGSATTYAVGLDPTNLVCEPASATSGQEAILSLGTLYNTTSDPDVPVVGEPVLVEIHDAGNNLVFSDSVLTDSDGKVYLTTTFNLPYGSYTVELTYVGSDTLYLAGSSCETGFLVQSRANGGGYVLLDSIDPKIGKLFKGTFGFYLDVTGGFTENDGDGLKNDLAPSAYSGAMNYMDHEYKQRYQAETVKLVTVGTNSVTFSGTGRTHTPGSKWESGYPYVVTVVDNGEPGNWQAIFASGASHDPDTCSLTFGGELETPYPELQGGNIEVRQ